MAESAEEIAAREAAEKAAAEAKKKKKAEKDEPKPEFTQAQLDERIAQALKAEREKAEKERADEKAKADAEQAKKQGDFQKLYDSEAARSKQLDEQLKEAKLSLRKSEIAGRLRDHVGQTHADYAPSVRYMVPLLAITTETTDEDADKQIKSIVEQYVKDNPRAKVQGTLPPPPRTKPNAQSQRAEVPDRRHSAAMAM